MPSPGRARYRLVALALGALATVLPATVLPATPGSARPSAGPGSNCVAAGQPIPAVPWPQHLFDPERVWPLATGRSVTVAVLDSGVDGTNQPQLRGATVAGIDFIDPAGKGATDCVGHGTQVAGIIAAQKTPRIGFSGLAPDVLLLSARVSDAEDGTGPSSGTAGLAHAIDWAVGNKADVINISLTTTTEDPVLRQAVARAVAADAVVVAAAGNHGSDSDGNPVEYPAAYPDVIGVGATDEQGHRWDQSEHGEYVDLVAPGVDVVSTQAGGGLVNGLNGTSYAAAFVSATAALVRSRYPAMTAPDVARRLFATATPAPGGTGGEYGYGIANPYLAVTAQMSSGKPAALPGLSPSPVDPAAAARQQAWHDSTTLTMALAAVAVLVALTTLGAARMLPMGWRRRWRAGLARPVRDDPEDEQLGPPVQLFDDL
jgi:type VII secretion-associated serine protease mycosin